MQGIAYLMILIVLYLMAKTVYNLKQDKISFREFWLWFIIWILALVAIFTDLLKIASTLLGVGRAVDLAIYLSILLLFFFVFKLFVRVEENNKITTQLIREIAIDEADKKYNPRYKRR